MLWRQTDKNTMVLQPITNYGWAVNDSKLTVVWDTPTNMQAIRDRVNVLLRGASVQHVVPLGDVVVEK